MSRKKKSSNRKKGSAIENCPIAKGIIVVQVCNSEDGKRLAGVTTDLSGETPGKENTDKGGQSFFYDRIPGTYTLTVSLTGSKYEHYLLESNSQKLSVLADDITIAKIKATPTGNLNVKIYVEDAEGLRSLVDDSEISMIYTQSPQALSESGKNDHTFQSIRCGKYDVFASVSKEIYDPPQGKQSEVFVPDGGTAEAEIIVTKKFLFTVKIFDKEEKQGLINIKVKLKIPDLFEKTVNTTADGFAEVGVKATSRSCEIVEISSTGDEYYEVLDVEQI